MLKSRHACDGSRNKNPRLTLSCYAGQSLSSNLRVVGDRFSSLLTQCTFLHKRGEKIGHRNTPYSLGALLAFSRLSGSNASGEAKTKFDKVESR